MIKVFALQPEVLLEESVIQRLEQFGFDRGRIIGHVPKGWRGLVRNTIKDADPRIKKKLELQLTRLQKSRVFQPLIANDVESSWITAAINVSPEFLQGIIVKDRSGAVDERILDLDDDFVESNVWNVATNVLSGRDVKSMASHVANLIRYAYEIKFVDPYFSEEKKHLDFIKECLRYRRNSPLKAKLNIEFHFYRRQAQPGDDSDFLRAHSKPFFVSTVKALKSALSDLLGPSDMITCCQWAKKESAADPQRFHERHVLTDLGGIEFGGGLDVGTPGQQTTVNLLSKPTVDILNNRFKKTGNEFELLHAQEFRV